MRDRSASDGFTLARWVGLAMMLPALIAVTLLGKDTLMVIERINDAALERDAVAIDRGLKMLGELNGSEVLSRTMQAAAFRHVVLAKRPDWIRENFGSRALTPDGVQQLVIVDPDGQVSFSSDNDGAPQHQRVAGLLAASQHLMDRARELYRSVHTSLDAVKPGSLSEGLFATDIVEVNGLPMMVTVTPFAPQAKGYQVPDKPTLLIGVQPLPGKLLGKLEALSHTQGLRLVSDPQAVRAGTPAHPIVDSQGNTVSYVTWNFSPPGYAILKAALPAILLSLAVIAILTLIGAFTMRRLTRKLAQSEQTAIHSSRHDTATGLANRGWFMRVFEDVLAAEDTRRATYAVLLVDCDHFKTINDTLGHAAGDAVLLSIANRLKGFGAQFTIAARLGGDEFAIVTAPVANVADAVQQVQDIQDALTASVLFENYVVLVGVSIGAAIFDAPSTLSIDTWLARADMALYRAKRDGRGCARIYDAAIDTGTLPLIPSTRQPANDRKPERAA
jgi:diguanylate cyclase (GGDEF)-like protein